MHGQIETSSQSRSSGYPSAATVEPIGGAGDGDAIELRELLRQLWRRKSVIASTILVITAIATLVVVQLTPLYTASSEVVIETRESRVVDIESVLSGLGGDASVVESEIEVITSTSVMEAVVKDLQLVKDPEFNPKLREPGPLAQIQPLAWVPETWLEAIGAGPEKQPPTTPEEKIAEQRAIVVASLAEAVNVSPIGRSRAIQISATSEDPRKAARIATSVADNYLDEQLEAKYRATKRATEWLNTRVAELREQVERTENRVEEFRAEAGLTEGAESLVSSQQISEINSKLTEARATRAEAEARLQQVQSLVNSGGVESAAEVLDSDLIQELRAQEAQVERRVAELSSEYGSRHPKMINAKAQLQDIQEKIDAEVRKIVQNLQNEVEVARARERTLQNQLTRLEQQSAQLSKKQVELRQLKREAEANRALYETFLSRLKETSNQQGLQTPDARIISEADPPRAASYPNKKLVVAGSLVFSALMGLGFAFMLEQLDHGYRSLEQIERQTSVGGLALVPILSRSERRRTQPVEYIVQKPASAYGEAIRSLHTSILLSDVDQPPKTVLLTSSLPFEGKTTMAASLARSVAAAGRKVLLIDADLRKPSTHDALNLSNDRGLVDLLADAAALETVVQRDEKSGLYVLPAGREAPNPPELLASNRMQQLLEAAGAEYDLVVIDSPPVQAVSDARILARRADKTVYIVRWAETRREVVSMGLKQIREAGADVAGIVLSMVNVRKHAQYGYGDSGSYYGYSRKYYTK
jgi:exopolysaccharide transport family protein